MWNYLVADGKWQKYTLWKFYAYTGGKSDELLLEHKEPEDGRTEEEKCEERERMCKEIAERLSLLQPEAEIVVYAYDYYELYPSTEWFCRAKGGNTTKEHVDHGLVRIMDYFKFHREVTILCRTLKINGMEYKEYLNQIICFNGDKDLLMMREKYNDPSFFEIISKERSETTVS